MIPTYTYHIKKIGSIGSLSNHTIVDVIGILVTITIASTIHKKDGTEVKICTTTIMNTFGFTIDVTF